MKDSVIRVDVLSRKTLLSNDSISISLSSLLVPPPFTLAVIMEPLENLQLHQWSTDSSRPRLISSALDVSSEPSLIRRHLTGQEPFLQRFTQFFYFHQDLTSRVSSSDKIRASESLFHTFGSCAVLGRSHFANDPVNDVYDLVKIHSGSSRSKLLYRG